MNKIEVIESIQAEQARKRLENWLIGIGIICILTVVFIIVGLFCFWLFHYLKKKTIYKNITEEIGKSEEGEEKIEFLEEEGWEKEYFDAEKEFFIILAKNENRKN